MTDDHMKKLRESHMQCEILRQDVYRIEREIADKLLNEFTTLTAMAVKVCEERGKGAQIGIKDLETALEMRKEIFILEKKHGDALKMLKNAADTFFDIAGLNPVNFADLVGGKNKLN